MTYKGKILEVNAQDKLLKVELDVTEEELASLLYEINKEVSVEVLNGKLLCAEGSINKH